MSPRGPSAPTSIPSYSCWARSIVFLALKWSLRAASCWSVEVMNGGAGFRLRSPRVTALTVHRLPWSPATTSCTRASRGRSAFSLRTSLRVATKSGGFFPRSFAWRLQYSTGTTAWISRAVISLNVTRYALRPLTGSSWARCQPIASPSRSGSVATYSASAFSAAFFSSSTTFRFVARTRYSGLKPFFTSTPSRDLGRSRTCPMQALTMYFESRYFWIVLTFVGDSTTTSDRFATIFSLYHLGTGTPGCRHARAPPDSHLTLLPSHDFSRSCAPDVVLAGQLSHPALQLQAQERCRRPPGRDAALRDQVIDVDRLTADKRQDSCLIALRGGPGRF